MIATGENFDMLRKRNLAMNLVPNRKDTPLLSPLVMAFFDCLSGKYAKEALGNMHGLCQKSRSPLSRKFFVVPRFA